MNVARKSAAKSNKLRDNVVLLSRLTGAEYFDGFVNLKDISAVVIRSAGEITTMITKNIGMLLLAIYLIAVGILTLTGLGIGILAGVLALLAGIFILIGR